MAIRSYQTVDSGVAAAVRDVVPDVIQNEAPSSQPDEPQFAALPPVERLDMSTQKKLLTIDDIEPALRGYRCFLALTNRIREKKGRLLSATASYFGRVGRAEGVVHL